MSKIFHIVDEYEEKYNQRGQEHEEYEHHLEKAFKEGCEHGYKKAMRELEEFNERGGRIGNSSRINYREGFEEKIAKLKEKYK